MIKGQLCRAVNSMQGLGVFIWEMGERIQTKNYHSPKRSSRVRWRHLPKSAILCQKSFFSKNQRVKLA